MQKCIAFILILFFALGTVPLANSEPVSSPLSLNAWLGMIHQLPAPTVGCFVIHYPNHNWQPDSCGQAPTLPLTVGAGNDEVAKSAGTIIGDADGQFTSVTGLTSESDSLLGANYYGLQVNSQKFACNTSYTGGKSATCWEQFLFGNDAGGQWGHVYIQYWLFDYITKYGACPTTGIPGGTVWMSDQAGSCYANSASKNTPYEAPTYLVHYSLAGQAGMCVPNCNNPAGPLISGQPIDQAIFCYISTCYTISVTMYVLNLYSNWLNAEFNVLGYADGSQAIFNPGTHITVQNNLEDRQGYSITPSCLHAGYTLETNNLNLGSCSSSSSGYISFTESN